MCWGKDCVDVARKQQSFLVLNVDTPPGNVVVVACQRVVQLFQTLDATTETSLKDDRYCISVSSQVFVVQCSGAKCFQEEAVETQPGAVGQS